MGTGLFRIEEREEVAVRLGQRERTQQGLSGDAALKEPPMDSASAFVQVSVTGEGIGQSMPPEVS